MHAVREAGVMAYRAATRYGLTYVGPTDEQRASGWRQVWRHPSGALAMRHPISGMWMTSLDGYRMDSGFASSLRAAASRINRQTGGGLR